MNALIALCALMAVQVTDLGLVPAPRKVELGGGECRFAELKPKFLKSVALPNEGYRLEVSKDGVVIASSTDAGAFWARQTLAQLARRDSDGWRVPAVKIEDAPQFGWRGLHLDESRHFFGKEVVKRFLDRMAEHKLNVFHWHLTDSAGWRIRIDACPELTDVGSVHTVWNSHRFYREYPGHKPGEKMTGLCYSKAEVREIVEYARARQIVIVPEIEIPGHSAEVARAYPELMCELGADRKFKRYEHDLCIGNEKTFRLFEKVMDEVCEMFDSEFIHIGGDECNMGNWKQCPRCQALMRREGMKDVRELQTFITRHFADYLSKKGRRIVGWSEIANGGKLPEGAAVMSWLGAKLGGDSVLCSAGYFYFDYEQGIEDDPVPNYFWGWPTSLEKVYSFDAMNASGSKGRILGGQANSWTEMTIDEKELEWKVWPRACAVAELYWSNPQPKNFEEFAARVEVDRRRMVSAGVNVAPITRIDPVWEALNKFASRIGGGKSVQGIASGISRRGELKPHTTYNGWENQKDMVSMSKTTRFPVGPQVSELQAAVGRTGADITLPELLAIGRKLADEPRFAAAVARNPAPDDLSCARLEVNRATGEVRAWYAIPSASEGKAPLSSAKAAFDAAADAKPND